MMEESTLWERLARLDDRCIVSMVSQSNANGAGVRRWRVIIAPRSGGLESVVTEDDSALFALESAVVQAEIKHWHRPVPMATR